MSYVPFTVEKIGEAFRVTHVASDSRVATCYHTENAHLVCASLNFLANAARPIVVPPGSSMHVPFVPLHPDGAETITQAIEFYLQSSFCPASDRFKSMP